MAERLALAIDNILLIDRLQLDHPGVSKEKRISA